MSRSDDRDRKALIFGMLNGLDDILRFCGKDHLSRQIQSRSQDQLDIRIRSICGNIDTE